jgi:hypothetical protein
MTSSPPRSSDVALAALARLRVDFAHNLSLLKQRDAELDRLVAELDSERTKAAAWRTACLDARRDADAWRQRCDEEAAAAHPVERSRAVVEQQGVQTDDADDAAVAQLRDVNAALKRTIAAMRARVEDGSCAPAQPCACGALLERSRRHVALLEAQRESLMEACNALRSPAVAASGGQVDQRFLVCKNVGVQTQAWAPPRHVDGEEEHNWRPDVASAPAAGVVGTQVMLALPRGLGVPASAKETASQVGVRAALQRRRERKRLGTAAPPRVRNWAVMD